MQIAQVIATDIGLLGEVSADRQRIRAFTPEPRIHKRDTIRLIVASVGLTGESQGLSFALRNDTFVGLRIQEVLHGEVGELQAQLTDYTG